MKLNPISANCNEVTVGSKTLLYSYQTLVGVTLSCGTKHKTAVRYSNTTQKHLNANGYREAITLPQATLDKLAGI